jgi:hypothetical protein
VYISHVHLCFAAVICFNVGWFCSRSANYFMTLYAVREAGGQLVTRCCMCSRFEDVIKYHLEHTFSYVLLILYNSLPGVYAGILEHVLLLWMFKA